jgi:hypothetical protein
MITGHGNGPWMYTAPEGSEYVALISEDPPAAERYTEVRGSDLLFQMVKPYIDKELLQMVPTYDGQGYEPTYLPSLLPLSLLWNMTGIAVGYSHTTMARTPQQLKDQILEILRGRTADRMVPTPPTGGRIAQKDELSYVVTGEWNTNGSVINIRSLPPNVSAAKFCTNLADKVKKLKKATNVPIKSVQDLSSGKIGIHIKIQLKRGRTEKDVLPLLYTAGLRKTTVEKFKYYDPKTSRPIEFTNEGDYLTYYVETTLDYLRKFAYNRRADTQIKLHQLLLLKYAREHSTQVTDLPEEELAKIVPYPEHLPWLMKQSIKRITKSDKGKVERDIETTRGEHDLWNDRYNDTRNYYRSELQALTINSVEILPVDDYTPPAKKAQTKKRQTDPHKEQAAEAGITSLWYNYWRRNYKGSDIAASFKQLIEVGKLGLFNDKQLKQHLIDLGHPSRATKDNPNSAARMAKQIKSRYKETGDPGLFFEPLCCT